MVTNQERKQLFQMTLVLGGRFGAVPEPAYCERMVQKKKEKI